MSLIVSPLEIVAGIAVEVGVFGFIGLVIFRAFSGRFLIPSRMVILPNQRGVIVQGHRVLRAAEPGTCWVRPKQRVVLCDMRIRSLHMVGVEIASGDAGIVRVSISGEFKIADPIVYYSMSTQANDALYVEVRKAVLTVGKKMASTDIVGDPEVLGIRLRESAASEAARLGLEFVELQVWEASLVGWLQPVRTDLPDPDDGPTTLVH